MNLMNNFVQIATMVAVFVAAATIFFSTQMSRRQMNVQVFTTYADRYESIMNDFPDNAFRARFNSAHELPPASEQLTLCVLRYLNMSSEEYYLWNSKYIDNKIWQIWEHEIQSVLASPLFKSEWPGLAQEFDSYPEFKRYVDSTQANHQTKIIAASKLD